MDILYNIVILDFLRIVIGNATNTRLEKKNPAFDIVSLGHLSPSLNQDNYCRLPCVTLVLVLPPDGYNTLGTK